uniref:FBA_2 domain-containing protein n=1 Tax=Caenorhabditis tropicalis TaxID=1561998 RepID=A0A1I7TUM3_9PELO
MMIPFELINLSLTSSRTRKAVICFSKVKSRFWVALGFTRNPFIHIKEHRRIGKTWGYSLSSDPFIVSTDSIFHAKIHKFSESPIEDCMKWYESIKEVLGCQIDKVCVSNLLPSITDWLRMQQESIREVSIWGGRQEDFTYLFRNLRISEKFVLCMTSYENNFQLEIPEGPSHLFIYTSKFINYDQLLKLKARYITLDQSILTNQEINGFLKSWMSCESHLDLKSFKINISGPEAVNEIMDLPHEVGRYGYKIKRSDGKEANVIFDRFVSTCLFESSMNF